METLSTKDFYYDLPEDRIAQTPEEKRDHSRLMVIHRKDGCIEDRHFSDIIDYLNPGDLLVMNNTRVLPARIFGKKAETGGKVEFLLLKRLDEKRWETMVKPGKKALPGAKIVFSDKLQGEILETIDGGLRIVSFDYEGVFEEILGELGTMPLPPYIHETLEDQERYQTVYAKHNGSAAAPTAGLHFTEDLIERLHQKGVATAEVTLHVGIGTFRPVKCDNITEHHMHQEAYQVPEATALAIAETKAKGGRVIAVGTTSVRTLESVARDHGGQVVACEGATDIFIYPGYRWQVVDGLITNFHLPESTLLMLVSSFYNREAVLAAYRRAVETGYRFFSFGDAMFIE
ncbi:MAG: tRNA preQ1(34) S-adenosylmethionine ribosyltransferase-isomerase QueA [Eubacterium sp.]|nr:tRNA preQ1(34) S-adenosylmethionine ribosyltransferase-isomerase QueA [Eubacterium sp.]